MSIIPRRVVAAISCCGLLTACTIGDSEQSSSSSTGASSSHSEDAAKGQPVASGTGEEQDEQQTYEPKTVTIAAAGDLLLHTPVSNSAQEHATGGDYNYVALMEEIGPQLNAADLAICHIEGPMNPRNENLNTGYEMVFNFPKEIARDAKRLGYDGCDFASNHTIDQGLDGLAETEEVVRDAGLGYAGPTMDEQRAGKAEVYDAGGAKIAHLAYTYTFPNNAGPTTDVPADAPWLEKALWPAIGAEGIREQARQAKKEGADFVVVSMHWGDEYQSLPNEQQQEIARELLEAEEVDAILGDHVHVVQPCEKINGKHVIYGLGNSISNQSPLTSADFRPDVQDGMVATLTLHRDESGKVTTDMAYTPTFVEIPGHTIRTVTAESNPASFARTTGTVEALGGCEATLYSAGR